MLIAI